MLTTLSRSLFGWRHNLQPSGDIDVNTGRGGLYATYFDKGLLTGGRKFFSPKDRRMAAPKIGSEVADRVLEGAMQGDSSQPRPTPGSLTRSEKRRERQGDHISGNPNFVSALRCEVR